MKNEKMIKTIKTLHDKMQIEYGKITAANGRIDELEAKLAAARKAVRSTLKIVENKSGSTSVTDSAGRKFLLGERTRDGIAIRRDGKLVDRYYSKWDALTDIALGEL